MTRSGCLTLGRDPIYRRKDCADVLDGTNLKQMADELGFWAFRVDHVFPEETHTRLVNLINKYCIPSALWGV